MNAAGSARAGRRRGARIGLVIVAAIILGGGVGLAVLISKGKNPAYPTTPEGWVARWNAAAAEFGRTPGENWDLWLDAWSKIEGETDPASVGPALDPLRDIERLTTPVPASIGTSDIWNVTSPNFRYQRDTLRAIVLPQIEASLASGETEVAADWIERAWSLARVGEATGTLIGGMVQAGVVQSVFDAVRPQAARLAGDPRIIGLIGSAPVPDIAWSLRMEREMGVMYIVLMADDFPLSAGDQAPLFEGMLADWVAYETAGDTAARDRVLAVFDRLANDRLFRLRRVPLEMITPSLGNAGRIVKASRVERDALLVMLALERWRADRGAYPASLDELVPEQLSEIPADPFGNNAPLRYRLVDPDSDDPWSAYVLYSVGYNGTDEGGVENRALVGRGLTDPDHGADHILNRLPPPPRPTGIIEDDPDDQPDQPAGPGGPGEDAP